MQVVLLVDLPLDSSIDTQLDDIRIRLAHCTAVISLGHGDGLLEFLHLSPRRILLLLHRVLEVAA